MTEAWKRLQSGSDIRGVAVAEPGKPATLTEAVGVSVGAAFAGWLSARAGQAAGALTVAVGRDSRVSGEALQRALERGLTATGVRVFDCGLCTTPAMFMTTVLEACDGAVMVTASHLPWQRNGYKFFTPEGGLTGAEISDILEAASAVSPDAAGSPVLPLPFLDTYAAFLMDKVRAALGGQKPLSGLHIVVDAGNGAGGFYAEMIEALGADVTGSQYLEPDGMFPNHIPNPEAPEAMASLSAAVVAAGADIGVLFDADCDRAALVDEEGREINRNRLIAMVSAILLREAGGAKPGPTIVTDSVTSAGLQSFLAERGGVLHRFKRGYRNVIDEAVRLNAEGIDCPLAIETSGHAALRENRFLDDGMYLVTRLIIEAMRRKREGGGLRALIDGLREPVDAVEVRMTIQADDFRQIGEAAIARVTAAAEAVPGWCVDPNNREGVRVSCGSADSWFLLRLSVHDPLLVLNAETDHPGGAFKMLSVPHAALKESAEIDLTTLSAYLGIR